MRDDNRPIPYVSHPDTGAPNLNWDPWYDHYIRILSEGKMNAGDAVYAANTAINAADNRAGEASSSNYPQTIATIAVAKAIMALVAVMRERDAIGTE